MVNGDEYRSLHPQYRELDRTYGAESVAHTAAWAGRMTEELIKSFSRMGYNLIIEGTLRTAEVPMKTAKVFPCKDENRNASEVLKEILLGHGQMKSSNIDRFWRSL